MQSHRYEYKIAGDTSNHDDIRIHVPSSKLFTMVGDLPLMHLDKALWFSAKCIVRTKCLSSKEHMPQFRCTSFMLDHLGCYLSHGTTTPTTQHSYGIACKLRTCMLRCSMQTLQCLQCTRKNIHPKPKALKPTDIMRSFLQWWVLALRMYNIYMLHTDETVRSNNGWMSFAISYTTTFSPSPSPLRSSSSVKRPRPKNKRPAAKSKTCSTQVWFAEWFSAKLTLEPLTTCISRIIQRCELELLPIGKSTRKASKSSKSIVLGNKSNVPQRKSIQQLAFQN